MVSYGTGRLGGSDVLQDISVGRVKCTDRMPNCDTSRKQKVFSASSTWITILRFIFSILEGSYYRNIPKYDCSVHSVNLSIFFAVSHGPREDCALTRKHIFLVPYDTTFFVKTGAFICFRKWVSYGTGEIFISKLSRNVTVERVD